MPGAAAGSQGQRHNLPLNTAQETVSDPLFETGPHTQPWWVSNLLGRGAGLKSLMLLPLPPEHQYYR